MQTEQLLCWSGMTETKYTTFGSNEEDQIHIWFKRRRLNSPYILQKQKGYSSKHLKSDSGKVTTWTLQKHLYQASKYSPCPRFRSIHFSFPQLFQKEFSLVFHTL